MGSNRRRTVVARLVVAAMVMAWPSVVSPSVALAATGDVSITTIDLALSPGMGLRPAGSWGLGFSVWEGSHGDLNGDGDTDDDVIHVWDADTGVVTNLSLPGTAHGAAAWGLSFRVRESDQGPGGTDLNGDGDTDDRVIHVWEADDGAITNLGLAGSSPRLVADWGLVFSAWESQIGVGGTDLNGDGDTSDSVVQVWDAASGTVANLGLAGEAEGGAAQSGFGFQVFEYAQGVSGTDLNGDGDTDDGVVHAWDSASGTVANLGLAGVARYAAEWGFAVIVYESAQGSGGTDLNSDGDTNDNVIHVWESATGTAINLGLAGEAVSGVPYDPDASWGFSLAVIESDQGPGGTDLNGDADTSDAVIHVWDAGSGAVTNLGLARAEWPFGGAATADFGAGFEVSEARQGPGGTDLNGDGDTSDAVIHVWNAATGTTANLGLASGGGTIGGNLHAAQWGFNFSVPEADQGSDLNGDGDTDDSVMHLWEDTAGTMTDPSLDGDDHGPAAEWGFSFIGSPYNVHVALINRAPIANPDSYTTAAGEILTVDGVLENDNDPDDDPLTAIEVTPPTDGDLTLNPDGSFTYEPDPGFSGPDSFTYLASDGDLDSSPATVSLTVEPSADLSLVKSVNGANPLVATDVVFTIQVTNAGPSDATGVAATDALGSGYGYVSDDGGGAYDDATGVWTIGNLASGATATLNITATVLTSGHYGNVAEVTAADQQDPDSTPANDDGDQSEDDEDSAFTTPVFPTCNGLTATIVGTPGPDVLTSGAADDVIVAWGGDDVIHGGGGNDTICAGAGDDLIEGGPGNDWIDGEAGLDTITYENAPAKVTVDLGNGTATGGDGTDTVTRVRHLIGSEHDDKLSGNALDNTIEGRGGNDKIKGKKGDDLILGGDGDDVILGRKGDDTINGGAGIDTASFFVALNPMAVDLGAGTAVGDGTDTLISIENVNGSAHDDSITGNGKANRLIGFKGNDTINGRGGDDEIKGKPGDDNMVGGGGDDDLRGGGGTDDANGGPGNDFCKAETTTACERP